MIIRFHIKEIIKLNFLKRNLDNNDIRTLLDLKNQIINHYELGNKKINIKNGNDILDETSDSKTLAELNIVKYVQVIEVYKPGIFFDY